MTLPLDIEAIRKRVEALIQKRGNRHSSGCLSQQGKKSEACTCGVTHARDAEDLLAALSEAQERERELRGALIECSNTLHTALMIHGGEFCDPDKHVSIVRARAALKEKP